jgi:hypothetical protein
MAPCWVAVELGTQVCINTITAVILTKHVHIYTPGLAGLNLGLENCTATAEALTKD